jgi:hypothetical protein
MAQVQLEEEGRSFRMKNLLNRLPAVFSQGAALALYGKEISQMRRIKVKLPLRIQKGL